MKPTNTDNITCLLLGHNFYKKELTDKSKDEVVCKNCGTQMVMAKNGDLDTSAANDKTFETALRQLFLLRRKLTSCL